MQRLRHYLDRSSISFQLFRLVVVVTTAALIISMTGGALLEWRSQQNQVTQSLATTAESVGIAVSAAIVFRDKIAAGEALRILAAQQEIEAAAVYSFNGKFLAGYGAAGLPDSIDPLCEHLPSFGLFSPSTTLCRPIKLDDSTVGYIFIRASLRDYRDTFLLQGMLTIGANLLGLLLALALGLRFVGRIVKPVKELADTSRQVRESGNFSLRASAPDASAPRDEVGELVVSFNAMLAEIEQRERELVRYHDSLERRVAERTEALYVANRDLQVAKDIAEAATKAKSSFLAHMSHEIRTPLNALIGTANLLQSDLPEAKRRLFLTTLQHSGQSLLALLNDVLDLSRIEANRIELEHVAFDPRQVIADSVDLFSGSAQEKGLRFDVEMDPGLTHAALGDPVRIRQVLNNLLSNALKFTPAGGITVRATMTMTRTFADSFVVRISVADTGIGVPPDKHEHIFESFQQADASTTREYGGSGLGLHIARELARRMGGDIRLESSHGQGNGSANTGSTFIFEVTLGRGAPADFSLPVAAPRAAAAVSLRGKNVLVVEDHIPSQLVVSELLQARGLAVRVAGNGSEALDRIGEQRPDLVLMDCQMPVMDGFEAMLRIRAQEAQSPHGQRVPIVAITANAIQRDLDRCRACGADDVLTKPLTPANLDRILADWLHVTDAAVPVPPANDPATADPDTLDPDTSASVLDRRNLSELRANTRADGVPSCLQGWRGLLRRRGSAGDVPGA